MVFVMDRSELRELVVKRDGRCMATAAEHAFGIELAYPLHECLGPLTLEHVTMVHSVYEGRVDNEAHCVALCAGLNGGTLRLAPHWMKEWFRGFLRERYPDLEYPTCKT